MCEIIQIDHDKAEIHFLKETSEEIKTIYLETVIDLYTRAVVGIRICIDPV